MNTMPWYYAKTCGAFPSVTEFCAPGQFVVSVVTYGNFIQSKTNSPMNMGGGATLFLHVYFMRAQCIA